MDKKMDQFMKKMAKYLNSDLSEEKIQKVLKKANQELSEQKRQKEKQD